MSWLIILPAHRKFYCLSWQDKFFTSVFELGLMSDEEVYRARNQPDVLTEQTLSVTIQVRVREDFL
jgi:hypothetical protein